MSLEWTFFLTVLAFKMFEEEEAKKKSLLEPQGQLVNAGLKPNRISPNWLLLFSSFASSSDLNYALAAQDLSKRMGLRFPMPLRNEALKQSDFHMIDCSIWYKLHTQWCRSSVLQTYHYSELFNWAEKRKNSEWSGRGPKLFFCIFGLNFLYLNFHSDHDLDS